MSQLPIFGIGFYLVWSLSSLGLLFDNSIWGWVNELLRSIVCLSTYHTFGGWKGFIVPSFLINVLYGVSVTISALSIVVYLLYTHRTDLKKDIKSGTEVENSQTKKTM